MEKKNRSLIQFKDYKLLDQKVEILRRYYNIEEIPVRLKNYVIFYNENEDNSYPNYAVLKQKYIMLKRITMRYRFKKNSKNNQNKIKKKLLVSKEV